MANTDNQTTHPKEWYEERIAWLEQFMLGQRIATMRHVASMRTRYMTILAENTFHPQNASALVRNCEAFGVQDLHTVDDNCRFNPNVNIVRGTDKWINIVRHASSEQAIEELRNQGYRIIATTPHRSSSTPASFDVLRGPFCLVFGTEKQGVSEQALTAADDYLLIPMCGFVESLNVSASAAILLHTLSARVRESVEGWQLGTVEQLRLLYDWTRESVKDADNILANRFGSDGL